MATEIEFTVSYEKETQVINMIDKQVMVSKTDITNKAELPGAELEVQDLQENIIDSWVSGTEPHYVSGLVERSDI